jgi:outer membrane protein TolC
VTTYGPNDLARSKDRAYVRKHVVRYVGPIFRSGTTAIFRSGITALLLSIAAQATAQTDQLPPLARLEGPSGAPIVITLSDALQRARQYDAQLQASAADATSAHEDRVQAKAALFPAISQTTQFLGNSPNGVNPNGRFVSLDGVEMYRFWGVAHQEINANLLTRAPLHRAQAAEAAAVAQLEVAQRGLAVTVTRNYYGLVAAERKYAATQLAVQQASRFLDITQQQERLGLVAHNDVIRAEVQARQQQQNFAEALLAMENARLLLAVMLFPTLNENFTVVDDLSATPALPPFADARSMAAKNNPELRAAEELLRAAGDDVKTAQNAFYPNFVVDAVYGIEANEFALHSAIAAEPELGILPNLGYFLTLNLTVPVWDWGGLRSKVHQTEARQRQAQVALSQAQRQAVSNLYSKYNEALTARSGADNLQRVADLSSENLRLTTLRYQAGEATAFEVVDAQNTAVQARNSFDDAQARYRVALAELQTLTGSF